MATPDDPVHQASHEAFPVDNPVQALKRDHNMVRKLADKYRNSSSAEVKKQAATQLLQAIQMHSRVEESVFYPGVRRIEPNLIARFEEEHLAVDDLLATLQGMSLDAPAAQPLVLELIDAVLSHIKSEEKELFPQLQHAAIDMTPIGLEMQAFEANLVHAQAQRSERGSRR
ncbi:MAG TPA: hemerythrin domain-containing protein [Telluria sp.]|jgi:hemerythrin superfamily protein